MNKKTLEKRLTNNLKTVAIEKAVENVEDLIVNGETQALRKIATPPPKVSANTRGVRPKDIDQADSLRSVLEGIPEFADERGKKYRQTDILCLLVLGMLMGGNDIKGILEILGLHKEAVCDHFGLDSLPSAPTFSRRLRDIDPSTLRDALTEQSVALAEAILGVDEETARRIFVIDGKGLRASALKLLGERTNYVTNVFDTSTSLCYRAHYVESKTSERAVAPEVLRKLNLEGAIVTGDAYMTDDPIRAAVLEGGGDYIFPVKDNNKAIRREMENIFREVFETERIKEQVPEFLPEGTVIKTWYAQEEFDSKLEIEHGHGRWEIREYHLLTNLKEANLDHIEGIESIGYVVRRRIYPVRKRKDGEQAPTKGTGKNKGVTYRILGDAPGEDMEYRESLQRLPYMLSHTPTVDEFARHVRAEWGIENKLHYRLDEVLREDRTTYRNDTVRENMAIIRRMAYNLLVAYESAGKSATKTVGETLRTKRIRLAVSIADAVQLVVGSVEDEVSKLELFISDITEKIRMSAESLEISEDLLERYAVTFDPRALALTFEKPKAPKLHDELYHNGTGPGNPQGQIPERGPPYRFCINVGRF